MSIGRPEESPGARFVPAQPLQDFVAALFVHDGLEADAAREAALILVEADLRGVWSHGVARASMYLKRLRSGGATINPTIKVDRVGPAAALVDGDDGLGLVVAPRAIAEAIALAKEAGVGLVGVKRSGHFATSAYYLRRATKAGCIGLAFTNSSPALAPWGGAEPFLGTSPLGFAAPTEPEGHFMIDMAMSKVARGKLKFAAARGEAIPEGYALDRHGRPTTDGREAFEGIVLPFGEHKGAALSWMMEVFAGVFTGAVFGGEVGNPFKDVERPQGVGHVFIAIRADLFMPMAEFQARMAELDRRAKSLRKAAGVEEILSPGEPETRREREHRAKGVPLPAAVIDDLHAEAQRTGITWPFG